LWSIKTGETSGMRYLYQYASGKVSKIRIFKSKASSIDTPIDIENNIEISYDQYGRKTLESVFSINSENTGSKRLQASYSFEYNSEHLTKCLINNLLTNAKTQASYAYNNNGQLTSITTGYVNGAITIQRNYSYEDHVVREEAYQIKSNGALGDRLFVARITYDVNTIPNIEGYLGDINEWLHPIQKLPGNPLRFEYTDKVGTYEVMYDYQYNENGLPVKRTIKLNNLAADCDVYRFAGEDAVYNY
jgi:hypothetical protein